MAPTTADSAPPTAAMAALSTHDVAHDLTTLAITAAKRRPLPVLPPQPLEKAIRELADGAHLEVNLQDLMTAPTVTISSEHLRALILSNQWSKVFREEEQLASQLVEEVVKLWKRPLKANEEARLKAWYHQARREVVNAAAKVEFDPLWPRFEGPPPDDFIIVARSTDWIPRERAMDFEAAGIKAFDETWHLGVDGEHRRFRHANPTEGYNVYYRVASGSSIRGLDAKGRHGTWERYVGAFRHAKRIAVIGPSGVADDKISLLYTLCQGTADIIFVFPRQRVSAQPEGGEQGDAGQGGPEQADEQQRGALLVCCTRDQLVALLGKGEGFPGSDVLLEWMEGGQMERSLYALGRGFHGGDDGTKRYNYIREGVVMELAPGLPSAVSVAVPAFTMTPSLLTSLRSLPSAGWRCCANTCR